jgi:hypothetical protein
MHAIIIGGLNCSYDVPYREDYFRAASVFGGERESLVRVSDSGL